MRELRSNAITLVLAALSAACSGVDTGPRLRVGEGPATDDQAAASARDSAVDLAPSHTGDGGTNAGTLRVHVENAEHFTLDILTLNCAGDCADIVAVAGGGNPPYAYAWDDGSSGAERRVCLDESTLLEVEATDTARSGDEFARASQSATVEVMALVRECNDDSSQNPDAATPEAGPDAGLDAATGDGPAPRCAQPGSDAGPASPFTDGYGCPTLGYVKDCGLSMLYELDKPVEPGETICASVALPPLSAGFITLSLGEDCDLATVGSGFNAGLATCQQSTRRITHVGVAGAPLGTAPQVWACDCSKLATP